MTAVSTHHHTALAADGTPGSPRWHTRLLLADLRDRLVSEDAGPDDGWLAARGAGMLRERDALLARIGAVGTQVVLDPGAGAVRSALTRLVVDVEHHLQRRRDLAWDEVELELGGSE